MNILVQNNKQSLFKETLIEEREITVQCVLVLAMYMNHGQIKSVLLKEKTKQNKTTVFVTHSNLSVISASSLLCEKVSHSCPVRANDHLPSDFCGEEM